MRQIRKRLLCILHDLVIKGDDDDRSLYAFLTFAADLDDLSDISITDRSSRILRSCSTLSPSRKIRTPTVISRLKGSGGFNSACRSRLSTSMPHPPWYFGASTWTSFASYPFSNALATTSHTACAAELACSR